MADSGGIPELNYNHPEGRLRTRLEMDQWLRNEIPKVHWLRIIANRVFGLTKQISWDMKEIVLKHWLLDEMVRRQFIVGDQLGVSTTSFNDEAELRQFTQRLAYFVQAGFAVSPQHAEGVDMNNFTPPPAPQFGAPNGQPAAYPPGPPQPPGPPGPPQGYAQPPMPPGPPAGPPQGYAQPPMPPGPPMPPQGYAPPQPPGPPQQQYAPPQQPQQQYAPPPPAAPPMAGPPMGPPPGVPQGPPQGAAPAAGPGRGRRKPADQQAAPPQGPPPGPPGAPQGFTPAPFPGQAPQQGFAPLPAPQQQQLPLPQHAPQQQAAPSVDLTSVNQKLDQLLGLVSQQATKIAALEYSNKVLACVVTVLARGTYQRQGSQDPVVFLQELGLPLPPQ